MLSKFYILLVFSAFLFFRVGAQHIKLDSVAQNIHNYAINNAQSSLFIHFDKDIYSNNDQVWFAGYLLKTITGIDQYHTLYLSLINNSDSSLVFQEKFLIEKGFSFGGFTLPDSLPSGSYRFVANTNIKKNNLPDGEFIQLITIKSTTINPLTANISVFRAYDEQRKTGTALVKVLTGNNRFVEGAEIKYQIGKGNQVLQAGSARSSVIGELMVDFPADKITAENNQFSIKVKKGKEVRYAKFDLPVLRRSKYRIQFYPEGGYLVDGLTSKVGFEIKELDGAVLKAKAVLYEDGIAIDTLLSNSTGIGTFSLCARMPKTYFVKLLNEAKDDTRYPLPTVLKNGVVLTAGTAIAENDFRIHLESNSPKIVHILAHNYSNILLHTELKLVENKVQSVLIKLDSVPVGLNSVTILDSDYRPIAERIFFAHYDRLNQTAISTDKEVYATREQVNLQLDIFGRDKKPLDALVSVACVQGNRLSGINNQNIVDYFYLQQYLKPLPNHPMSLKYIDQDYLNDILLVKTWSRYKWPETEISDRDRKDTLSNFEYKGKITKKNKPLDKPMDLTTIAGENLGFLNTDSVGEFTIPYENLMVKAPKIPVWLAITTAKYDQYDLKMDNPHDELKKYLMQQNFEYQNNRSEALNANTQSINMLAGIRLKEVTISKSTETTEFAKRVYNRCGDYVCRFNILNCPNHFADSDNRMPVKGNSYSNGRGTMVIYHGCTDEERKPNVMTLKGINLPKEFYVSDISDKNEPINFATVYWNYQVLVKGETPISFNTGDLTGRFKIIIQGVTDGGVVYGEKEIVVESK